MCVFEQIHPEETHHDDVIVELVPKTKIDIMPISIERIVRELLVNLCLILVITYLIKSPIILHLII